MTEETFARLRREVWEGGRCAGCGACLAVCPADAFSFPEGPEKGHPTHTEYCKQETDGVPCGACYDACPRAVPRCEPVDPVGAYLKAVQARAAFPIRGKQSGGAVTAILRAGLEAGLVDAVVTVAEDPWTRGPYSIVVAEGEELVHHAGSRYSWWVPLLASLKEAVVERKYRRLAVVGVPCAVQAVHRMRTSRNDLLRPFGQSVRLLLGLFCTESFDYELLIGRKLGEGMGIRPWEIVRMDVKGDLRVSLSDGRTIAIPVKELQGCVREGCSSCTDFTATEADISAGSVGAREGFTSLLVRTQAGEGFLEHAISRGMLETDGEPEMGAIRRLAEKKAARGERRGD